MRGLVIVFFLVLLSVNLYADVLSTGKSYTYSVNPSGSYPDNGYVLTNGTLLLSDGEWSKIAGWQNNNSTITIDLGNKVNIDSVQFYSYLLAAAGIYPASSVSVTYSDDNVTYSSAVTDSSASQYSGSVYEHSVAFSNVKAKYLKISFVRSAEWTFISEFVVNGSEIQDLLILQDTKYKFLLALSGCLCGFILAFGLLRGMV